MNTVICNGTRLNYRTVGYGEDIVLIHGLAANHAFWHLKVLLSLAREYRVTVYDLRGHGLSEMPADHYSSLSLANDLNELINHLEIEQAHLIGHSLGGVVALQYARLYPTRVRSLTVADSRIRSLQSTNFIRDWPNGQLAMEKLHKLGLEVPDDEPEAGLWLLERLALPEFRDAKQQFNGSALSIPFGRWNGGARSARKWLKLLGATTIRQDLQVTEGLTREDIAAIKQPIFALYGEFSSSRPSLSGLRQSMQNYRDVIIPGAGHFFPLTRPEIFTEHVRRFLREHAQASSS